ncbi:MULTISPECIES: hypothetical protein [Clostridium]|uniref:hypothetical protein n=1 Tax=Clostridium TaxID=1485 RepID=UPI00232E2887|nr:MULTISPECIES: hypothetical protein [Clostridium]MDB2104840.1 hypothetical protein [Clostridium paraputrificum]MDU2108694.1 hypothetical protein [Clostridium sp.]MDU3355195.1 hypothetical protein [Clostridium sp.]MDU4727947.1 hypothetical protein [Clostridium sp.]
MANRERKIYMLSQKNIDYIEEVKEKNNLKYNSEALDLIIREHRKNSDITTEAMIKLIAKEVSNQIKIDVKGIKKSSNETDRNTQILLELINGFFVISKYGRLATTDDILSPALTNATEIVDKRIKAKIVKGLDERY